ncbi:MAG: ABC transporter substrate-binding protein [Chloroflexi bacterium]|nr:ABC transporter substrate-binding protein [Chloroflexota bacterium]
MRTKLLAALGAMLLALAACGPAAQEATATPTNPPVRATTAPSVTATPLPQGPTPAAAAAAAAATATPAPVATAAPAIAKPKYGGVLKTPLRTDPFGWDVMQITGGYLDMRKQFIVVFNTLASQPSTPEVKPCQTTVRLELLESWRVVDETTVEFKLRPGLKFHNKPPVNGREATADDLAYSLNRALFVYPIRGADSLAPRIKSIDVVDKYTVRLKTAGPVPQVPTTLLATQYGTTVVPKEVWPKEVVNDPYKAYIGTGPFMFKEYRPGVKVVHEKNPSYWKEGLPYLDGLEYVIMPDISTRTASLRSGRLDMIVEEVPAPIVSVLEKDPRINIQGCPATSGYNFLWMDAMNPKSPFSDLRVRRAVSMAVDRDNLLKSTMQGRGYDTPHAPPALHEWYLATGDFPPEIRKYLEYRPEEAKKLLAEAGYPPGSIKTGIEITAQYTSPYPEIVQALNAQLAQVGIEARLNWMEYATWLQRGQVCKWEGMRIGRMAYEDEWRHLAKLNSKIGCAENKAGIADPGLDPFIDQLLVTVDPAKQKELAAQIQFRIVDQAWVVSIPDVKDYSAANIWVKNWNRGGYAAFASTYNEIIWLDR